MATEKSDLTSKQNGSYTDIDAGTKSASITVNTTKVITLPANASYVKIYPTTNSIRFAISATPAAVAALTGTDAVTVAADFALGAIAKNDQWEVRQLPSTGTTRTLSLLSLSSTVVEVEVA